MQPLAGAFLYRLGHGPLKAERRVRFPYALPPQKQGVFEDFRPRKPKMSRKVRIKVTIFSLNLPHPAPSWSTLKTNSAGALMEKWSHPITVDDPGLTWREAGG